MELTKGIIFFLLLSLLVLPCQGGEGFKHIKNYTYEDHSLLSQGWKVLQDRRGIIYVADQEGLLEFDSISWRTIPIPRGTARSMDIDNTGSIYIGGLNEIGYLEPDNKGTLRYVSLKDYLDKNNHGFPAVYQVLCTVNGVWFRTEQKLFLWNDKKFTVYFPQQSESRFKTVFTWKDNDYVQETLTGLHQVKNGAWSLISKNEAFTGEKIYVAVPYDDQHLLMGTRKKGFPPVIYLSFC